MAFGTQILNATILLLVVANCTQDVAAMDGCNGFKKNSIYKGNNDWKCGDQCL